MDVLESSQDLVEKVAHMIIAQVLCLEQFVQICLHQSLYDVAGRPVSQGFRLEKREGEKGGRGEHCEGYTSFISARLGGRRISRMSMI